MNEKIKIKLNDESVFSIESNDQISALRMKLDVDDLTIDEFTPFFTKEVEKHWNDRTVLTKFPWDRSWEEDLKDEIWHKLYHKLHRWEDKEVKKTFGYDVASLNPVKWFDNDVKEENAKLIKDGVALKDNKLILRNDTKEAKTYWEISERFSEIVKKETEKEFERRKDEAKNRFKNQAELAKAIFYQYVRPYLIGILLGKLTKGKAGSLVSSDEGVSFVGENTLVSKRVVKKDDSKSTKFIVKNYYRNQYKKTKQNEN
ncbi:hypothetical protein J4209_03800 [Candidatus Woesearchaeota archaeon]|nr:hypothetical protein [Candidatus Woesearchaeota archaeon]